MEGRREKREERREKREERREKREERREKRSSLTISLLQRYTLLDIVNQIL